MSIWFKGEIEIDSDLNSIKSSLQNLDKYFMNVVSVMPGMRDLKLVDSSKDKVAIKTNEGLMTRKNIKINSRKNSIQIDFDEVYQAGNAVTVESHYKNTFSASKDGVIFALELSQIKTRGFIGRIYKIFSRWSIGKAVLSAHKQNFEDNSK